MLNLHVLSLRHKQRMDLAMFTLKENIEVKAFGAIILVSETGIR